MAVLVATWLLPWLIIPQPSRCWCAKARGSFLSKLVKNFKVFSSLSLCSTIAAMNNSPTKMSIMKKMFAAIALVSLLAFAPKEDTYTVDKKASNVHWLGKKTTGQHEGDVALQSGTLKVATQMPSPARHTTKARQIPRTRCSRMPRTAALPTMSAVLFRLPIKTASPAPARSWYRAPGR